MWFLYGLCFYTSRWKLSLCSFRVWKGVCLNVILDVDAPWVPKFLKLFQENRRLQPDTGGARQRRGFNQKVATDSAEEQEKGKEKGKKRRR